MKSTCIEKENTISVQFSAFANNVFCRRQINQHKAKKLWKELKEIIPNNVASSFETEWNHYMMGEFDPNKFGLDIEILKGCLTIVEGYNAKAVAP